MNEKSDQNRSIQIEADRLVKKTTRLQKNVKSREEKNKKKSTGKWPKFKQMFDFN